MKKITILSTMLLTSTFLIGCGASNPCAGKSFTFQSISTKFDRGSTESEFFDSLNTAFSNVSEIENQVKDKLLSCDKKPTSNGKLNIDNVAPTNKVFFNSKQVTVYTVNKEEISEYESSSRCLFGNNPEKANSYHFYDHGKFDPQTTDITVGVYNFLTGVKGNLLGNYAKYSTFDDGVTFENSTLTISLITSVDCYEESTFLKNVKCSTVVTFTL